MTRPQYLDEYPDVLAEFWNSVNDSNTSGTAVRYSSDLRTWIDWLHKNDLTIWDANTALLHRYLSGRKGDGYSKSALRTAKNAISRFYEFADETTEDPLSSLYQSDEIPPNPTDGYAFNDRLTFDHETKKKKVLGSDNDIHSIHPRKIQMLVDNVPAPAKRNALIVRMLYQTGMRRHECAELQSRQIDRRENERSITIPKVKNAPEHTTYYRKSLNFSLAQWIDVDRKAVPGAQPFEDPDAWLFPTHKSDHITGDHIGRMVVQAAKNAGIQWVMYEDMAGHPKYGITAHVLRHSYCYHMAQNNANILDIKETAGHRKLETTKKYIDASKKHIKRGANLHGPGLGSNGDWVDEDEDESGDVPTVLG